MVGWHHQLNGQEFEQTVGDNGGQKGLVCCSPWVHKVSDRTEWLNNKTTKKLQKYHRLSVFRTTLIISHSSRGRQPRSRHVHIWCLMKVWPLIHTQLAESSCGGSGRELPGVSIIRALIPFMRAPSSWPYHLPKALPPNIITLGIGFQHMDCGEKVA